MESIQTIDPRRLAEKLEAVRNFLLPEIGEDIVARPRLAEALWFLAWLSVPDNYAGGLAKFTQDFIVEYASQIGPVELIGAGERQLSRTEIEQIYDQLPSRVVADLTGIQESESVYCLLETDESDPADGNDVRQCQCKALEEIGYIALQSACIDAADEELAAFFTVLCTEPETGFQGDIASIGHESMTRFSRPRKKLWYFPLVWDCFFDWVDKRAEAIRATIADTIVTKEVFRWLDLASRTQKGVMIVGNSRSGKTEAVRAYGSMYPSRVRIIETPSSACEGDLYRAIARALGIPFSLQLTKASSLRAEIDFVLRQSRLMLVFDEAQFLFPSNGTQRKDPPRLNYVRRSIMDLGLPTAFICTPQSWKRAEKTYLKATGYTIEQFEGRLLRNTIYLPEELSREDMLLVAGIHFPTLSDDHREYVVKLVRAFQGSVLSCIQNIADLSKIYAQEAGRETLRFSEIKRAVDDVLPRRQLAEVSSDASSEAESCSEELPAAFPAQEITSAASYPERQTSPFSLSQPKRGALVPAGDD